MLWEASPLSFLKELQKINGKADLNYEVWKISFASAFSTA